MRRQRSGRTLRWIYTPGPAVDYSANTMASAKTLKWIQNLVWILIYAGLLTLVLGVFTERSDYDTGSTLVWFGGALAAAGVLLIWVRSRLRRSRP